MGVLVLLVLFTTSTVLGANLDDYLLPTDVIPLSYDIELVPYLEIAPEDKNFTFDGVVSIMFKANATTDKVVLHAHSEVTISEITIDNNLNVTSWNHSNDDRSFLTLSLNSNIETGQLYTLKIEYSGVLNNNLEGFYRSSYYDDQENTRWLAVSMFAPVGARRAFPCFDEPQYKATFTLHIAHQPDYIVLANMPKNGSDTPLESPPSSNWSVTHFMTSVPMSTYLVAFSVNQFVAIVNANDSSYSVWARPEGVEQGHYANDIAPYIVNYMKWYTDHEYVLEKLDQVAIPDFAANAMENWGLITFRETALLFAENISTTYDRQRVETIVTHEIAHQWFGNLVTPAWWSVVWLSEGFATYFEYHALAYYRPNWQLDQQFVQREMQFVMQQDATEGTHPLLQVVNSTYDANAAFDDIVYLKGASILRMLEQMLGLGSFRAGLRDYCRDLEFSTADMDDVWRALQTFIIPGTLPQGETLKSIMDTWTLQSGYPVVTVTRNYDNNGIKITQERFMTQRNPDVSHNEKWIIPLTVQTAAGFYDEEVYWHVGPEMNMTSLNVAKDQWVLFNVQETGYYRVNYDQANWQLLSSAQLSLHPLNRAQMMDDALSLARADLLDYPTALDTTRYLDTERDYVPWAAGLAGLGFIWDRLSNQSDSRANIEWYLLNEMGPIYNEMEGLEISQDSHVMALKRNLILQWSCLANKTECITEANTLFKQWMNSTSPDTENPISPDLKSVVYCEGMRQGGRPEYDFLFMRYEKATNYASEQFLILTALGCATDQALLEEYLWASITPNSGIRSQNSRDVFESVYKNYWGVDLALDFLLTNYFDALPYYNSQFGTIDRVFSGISVKLNTQEHRDQLQTFYDTTELGEAEPAVQAAINTVDEILAWHEAYRNIVIQYLVDVKNQQSTGAHLTMPTLTILVVIAILCRSL